LFPHVSRAGEWFLCSGIQESNGGVARYHRADLKRNAAVSTEITGYTASALIFLHRLTGKAEYLDRAVAAARFLAQTAWDAAARAMPYEIDPSEFAYFFDSGIIVRGLLAVWRTTGEDEFIDAAAAVGRHMMRDFAGSHGFHPILELPGKAPVERDGLRWSRSAGCYQLKAAMAWLDLADATGDSSFRAPYHCVLDASLRTYTSFLPGHPERPKVMDRLHAFSYFLEGLLAGAGEGRACAAMTDGIGIVADLLRDIGPEFERSDVYAQLLRARIYADRAGLAPLDREAAAFEAARLEEFQRPDGGFWFGRTGERWLPYVNPVSAAFALQALAMWQGAAAPVADLI
jgi:hypothetical protein